MLPTNRRLPLNQPFDLVFLRPKVPFSSRPSVPDHRSPHHLSPQDGAFALQVGEMSGVVDSDSGVHIIIRTA
jgi:hypothetical protein